MKSIEQWGRELKLQPEQIQVLVAAYAEPHRYWHGHAHITSVLEHLEQHPQLHELDTEAETALKLAALYHDVIYDVGADDNEEQSALLLQQHLQGYARTEFIDAVMILIRETDYRKAATSTASTLLRAADTAQLRWDLPDLLGYGYDIYGEYQRYPYHVFVPAHLKAIMAAAAAVGIVNPAFDMYEAILRRRVLSVGVYAGSFRPWHAGHTNITYQALPVFDKIILARGRNPEKTAVGSEFEVHATVIEGAPAMFETVEFSGPLWKLYQHFQNDANYNVTMIRGLRDAADLTSEVRQRTFVQDQAEVPYAFFAAHAALAHISSSAIRALDSLGADTTRYR